MSSKNDLTRSFIAFDLPEEIKERVFGLYQPLFRKFTPYLRWTKKENLHMTVKFLGDLADGQIREVSKTLSDLKKPEDGYDLAFLSCGTFPPERQPRILWIGLAENERLRRLVRELEDRMAGLGFERERREFVSHITVARLRIRTKDELENFRKIEKEFRQSFERLDRSPFLIDRITLFKSVLQPQGSLYLKIAEF